MAPILINALSQSIFRLHFLPINSLILNTLVSLLYLKLIITQVSSLKILVCRNLFSSICVGGWFQCHILLMHFWGIYSHPNLLGQQIQISHLFNVVFNKKNKVLPILASLALASCKSPVNKTKRKSHFLNSKILEQIHLFGEN